MKTPIRKSGKSGYISLVMVLATAAILSALTFYAYKRAGQAQNVEKQVQLRLDYSEKEDAILRSIVAIVPNRAIRAMKQDSDSSGSIRNPLRWTNIFSEALDSSNARTSIPANLKISLNIPNLIVANPGDSSLSLISNTFSAIGTEGGLVSTSLNRSLGAGYPPPLTSTDSTTTTRDATYPLISTKKIYGSLAQPGVGLPVSSYPDFNLLKYPQINFGYAKPGEDFVAKRNWWAFTMDAGGTDQAAIGLARRKRQFVLSIYEIPSQLAISASAFMSLGKYASGDAWQNVTIDGGIFAGQAQVEGTTTLDNLSARRGMSLSGSATIGGQTFSSNPFAAGVREAYQVTQGKFFPVSLASESGRAAFIPINRGADYFDRFSAPDETNTVSTTTWNDYSVGARQCAMRLDITGVQSSTNRTPTRFRFSYIGTAGDRRSIIVPLDTSVIPTLPPGYVKVCNEHDTYNFIQAVDVAYGVSGGFTFRSGLSGPVRFENDVFGDPKQGDFKAGYYRPRAPFEIASTPGGQICVALYPQRLPGFLATFTGGDAAALPAKNNSIAVNVDYSTTGLNDATRKPSIPCTANDYGVILKECANLTPFTRGFSLVTNLRLYIGDDFNTSPATPPTGYTPAGTFYPPCSLFTPEKRYGVDVDPFAVTLSGQIGSLAKGDKVNASDADPAVVRPLDSTAASGNALDAARITVNLRPIKHPAELPPIFMLNWLVLLEERRAEFY